MGQIEKFWCLSDREFSDFFKNGLTFYSSSTQWPTVTISHKSLFFLGHPVSDREFSEFFKNGPSFYSSSTQWPSVNIFHKSQFFLGHPVYIYDKGQKTGFELASTKVCKQNCILGSNV